MVEAGKLQEALEHLDKHAHHVVDEIFVQETRGWFMYHCVSALNASVFVFVGLFVCVFSFFFFFF